GNVHFHAVGGELGDGAGEGDRAVFGDEFNRAFAIHGRINAGGVACGTAIDDEVLRTLRNLKLGGGLAIHAHAVLLEELTAGGGVDWLVFVELQHRQSALAHDGERPLVDVAGVDDDGLVGIESAGNVLHLFKTTREHGLSGVNQLVV